ncbi:hypothetical protein [Arthrobacter sp. HY1533]|uniref:hypothetical protein n=1 Tax=Arthrobacter sp. HY1533 TaxID=2970919 RepID=UPI0022B9D786|nr:hypothetical protein [Arthrobacter sp. HY1533]
MTNLIPAMATMVGVFSFVIVALAVAAAMTPEDNKDKHRTILRMVGAFAALLALTLAVLLVSLIVWAVTQWTG